MLTEPTIDKLKNLHLYAMANASIAQQSDPAMNEIDFDARLSIIVDAEMLARDNKRIGRLLREAKLRIPGACIEDIDFAPKRDLERATRMTSDRAERTRARRNRTRVEHETRVRVALELADGPPSPACTQRGDLDTLSGCEEERSRSRR